MKDSDENVQFKVLEILKKMPDPRVVATLRQWQEQEALKAEQERQMTDDDYDYQNRTSRLRNLDYNERAFRWAELSLNKFEFAGETQHFFPVKSPVGTYYIALIFEYGCFKSFDFLRLEIKSPILSFDDSEVIQHKMDLTWNTSKGLRGFRLRRSLSKVIDATDYHGHIRPT